MVLPSNNTSYMRENKSLDEICPTKSTKCSNWNLSKRNLKSKHARPNENPGIAQRIKYSLPFLMLMVWSQLQNNNVHNFHRPGNKFNKRVNNLLGITNLHNGMTLSTLSISSHGFAFGFPKKSHTNGDVFLTYKLMINPLISRCGTTLPTILNTPPLEQSTLQSLS